MAFSNHDHLVLVVMGLCASITGSYGAKFTIQNFCKYTVWPASFNPSSGFMLPSGQQAILTVPAGQQAGRIWGRTVCNYTSGPGRKCITGDCGGLYQCRGTGEVPASLVEFSLNTGEQNLDFYDISLVDGFNLPIAIYPSVGGGTCIPVVCRRDINRDCPSILKAFLGCKSACVAFPHNDQYCCRGQFANNCPPSSYSQFFKSECPQAYSYAKDDASSTFVCPGGTDYTVAFCP